MTGPVQDPPGWPLVGGDPSRLGGYQLLSRLGEGGMGRVYLGRTEDGRLVAIKVIRADLLGSEEFRRRFRREVARARQVPPFCTAEVLDADPDHDPPYLVQEFVDGPDLATVVRQRGPLSPGNLHGLAIGVATALAAIHHAGIIHRDLKPSNVLLAPGTPKVIDFGLARGVGNTTAALTLRGEVMGTVAYMAPERIEPAVGGRELTQAADIFAWGAVVAYAGTGRSPFAAGTLPAVAVRILTQEPDLDRLDGQLHDLVAEALAKDPEDRPTARDLLDRLLVPGRNATTARRPSPSQADLFAAGERNAHLDADVTAEVTQPLRRAVTLITQPVTHQPMNQLPMRQWPTNQPPNQPPPTAAVAAAPPAPFPAAVPPPGRPPAADDPAAQTPPPTPTAPAAIAPAPPVPPLDASPEGRTRGRPFSRRRRSPWRDRAAAWRDRRFAVSAAVTAVVLVLATATVIGGIAGYQALTPRDTANSVSGGAIPPLAEEPTDDGADPVPAGTDLLVVDPLNGPAAWVDSGNERFRVTCRFTDGLAVASELGAAYRCLGPALEATRLAVYVDVMLIMPDSCAAIWFRFSDPTGGYALRVCEDGYHLSIHGTPEPHSVRPLAHASREIRLGLPTRVGLVAVGDTIQIQHAGEWIAEWQDTTFDAGEIWLGLLQADGDPPYRVWFRDVAVYGGE